SNHPPPTASSARSLHDALPILCIDKAGKGGNAMSSREEALEKLRAQIAAQREKLDPKVLKAAQRAAEIAQNPQKSPDSLIPYDRDRKSTRLNSSHVKISYAVFC